MKSSPSQGLHAKSSSPSSLNPAIKFREYPLKVIDRQMPLGLEIHLIMDNYATHKHPTVKSWLARHPRFHLHFTPTSSS
jgi:DDE superfamily endonuclease